MERRKTRSKRDDRREMKNGCAAGLPNGCAEEDGVSRTLARGDIVVVVPAEILHADRGLVEGVLVWLVHPEVAVLALGLQQTA